MGLGLSDIDYTALAPVPARRRDGLFLGLRPGFAQRRGGRGEGAAAEAAAGVA